MSAQPSNPPEGVWPNGPCKPGEVYVMDTLFNDIETSKSQRIIIMSETSWGKFGTDLELLRRTAKQQDQRIKELAGEVALARQAEAEMLDKLNAHREIRRREKRAELEGDLIVPGDSRFNTRK